MLQLDNPDPKVLTGENRPLGATPDAEGVNFAVFSENAEKIELCLFDSESSRHERERIPLFSTEGVWHARVLGLKPGQLYGYRAYGAWDPERGHRFNPHKVLLDPYARAIGRHVRWDDRLFGYRIGNEDADLSFDERDDADIAPLGMVTAHDFDWGGDKPPRVPWNETVIYELHVKGFTQLHPEIPERERGTYGALASGPVIGHLKKLGVTAVELLPVHYSIADRPLVDKGLVNYWGYNSVSFFAPNPFYSSRYEATDILAEFKGAVKALHAAGIEVILDVVYNHTAEGNQLGPHLSFRGLDNASYYRLSPESARYYQDFTGCGNSLNMRHPRVLQLIMDSLRYYVQEMHVDGFRFDLASVLARELHAVDRLGSFFDAIGQDPVISGVKLIAEPWDLGEGGYQVGNFPPGWAEWNGRYRDDVRRFWKGDGGLVSELANRLSGSSDLYDKDGRKPYASVNFVTCHDGFTLHDLVSYDGKHNDANGEENRDGMDDNLSWNCGAEGPTGDPAIRALREKQKRNLLATLLCSQGVPMLLAGDELGQTQDGNNNAYCQDNEISWIRWDREGSSELRDFVADLIAFRKSQPGLRRRDFFQGRPIRGGGEKDILWLTPAGTEMTDEEWKDGLARCLGIRLEALEEKDKNGNLVKGEALLVLINAHHEAVPFVLPDPPKRTWESAFLTDPAAPVGDFAGGSSYRLEPRSLAIFRLKPGA